MSSAYPDQTVHIHNDPGLHWMRRMPKQFSPIIHAYHVKTNSDIPYTYTDNMGGKQSFPVIEISKERVFVVTGANTGIGYETAKWIAMMGGTVIMACRSEDRAMKAIREMDTDFREEKARGVHTLADVEELSLEFMQLDLASFQSTKDFVQAFKRSGRPLHVLICSAGISASTAVTTEDGFEAMLQVNYLSHFLMIGQLLPLMKGCGDDVRLVLVSSAAHWMCRFDLAEMNYTGEPEKMSVIDYYGKSKLYQVMQMHCLQRRLRDSSVSVASLHPGLVDTELTREFTDRNTYKVFSRLTRLLGIMRTRLDGATTVINCAVNPDLKGVTGVYYKDCKPGSTSGTSRDENKQEAVWTQTMEYLKDHFSEEILKTISLLGRRRPRNSVFLMHVS